MLYSVKHNRQQIIAHHDHAHASLFTPSQPICKFLKTDAERFCLNSSTKNVSIMSWKWASTFSFPRGFITTSPLPNKKFAVKGDRFKTALCSILNVGIHGRGKKSEWKNLDLVNDESVKEVLLVVEIGRTYRWDIVLSSAD